MIPIRAPAEHYRSPIVRVGLRIFAVLLVVVVGIVGTVKVFRSILDARASGNWPTVPGTIRSSDVIESSAAGTKGSYRASVFYSYVVDGQG
jgi:hypothetical protein